MSMRMILVGPPGAGKGTQAEAIRQTFPIAHISTGDMLRVNVRNATELGVKAKAFMDDGKLVADELIIDMMRLRLSEKDAKDGFILDGFPRTVAQAEALDELLQELTIALDVVILLELSDDAVIRRLSNRRVCSNCGAIYNAISNPPKVEDVCDLCGGTVIQRDDDRESVIRNRLSVYREQTAPVVEYYRKKGILHRVDAAEKDSVRNYLVTLRADR